MHPRPYVLAPFLFLLASPILTFGAVDSNGYTAQYECRAGNPNCNVDVASLGKRACDQVIKPSTPWSSIQWSNNTICLEAGDHTGKGVLTIPPSANGTSANYKVLRYYHPADVDDEPWRQSSANQTRISRLVIEGDYWLVHRLTFPGQSGKQPARITFSATSSNDVRDIILNRILIEGGGPGSHYYGIATDGASHDYQGLAIQNSVLRNLGPLGPDWEAVGISLHVGHSSRNSRYYIINNEIYDWVSHPIQIGRNQLPVIPGIVVENNDLYVTPKLHRSDGRAASEAPLSIKASGTAAHPIKIIHNRIWGARWTDTGACCTGESGQAITTYNTLTYLLLQNNIIGESHTGSYPTDRSSWIGNIFYGIKKYYDCGAGWCNSHVLEWGGTKAEVYLNTVIDNTSHSFSIGLQPQSDLRCNVLISASGRDPFRGSSVDATTQIDYNTFYDSPKFTYNGGDNNIVNNIKTRQNSTSYNVGDIIRTGPLGSCTTATDSRCFLYRVTVAGRSGSSSPPYCTSLGCTTNDGEITATAIRGPYTYYRKLRTSPERYTIPYARPYALASDAAGSAPEAFACPSGFASRAGIGVSDD